MEDAKIEALEDLGGRYAQVRDDRMALTKREVELKGAILSEMRKQKRDHYEHENVEIEVVSESETVKVRIHKPKKAEDAEPERAAPKRKRGRPKKS
jgi:hypothetical protein